MLTLKEIVQSFQLIIIKRREYLEAYSPILDLAGRGLTKQAALDDFEDLIESYMIRIEYDESNRIKVEL